MRVPLFWPGPIIVKSILLETYLFSLPFNLKRWAIAIELRRR